MRSIFVHVGVQAFLWLTVSSLSTGTRQTTARNMIMSEETSRRSWLSATVATTSAFLAQVAFPANAAAANTLEVFEDPECGFQIKIPSQWEKQVKTLPDRRKIVLFIDPTVDKTLFFAAFTPIRDDFTQLSSFGSVDQVGVSYLNSKLSFSPIWVSYRCHSLDVRFNRWRKPRFFPREAWLAKTMKAPC